MNGFIRVFMYIAAGMAAFLFLVWILALASGQPAEATAEYLNTAMLMAMMTAMWFLMLKLLAIPPSKKAEADDGQ